MATEAVETEIDKAIGDAADEILAESTPAEGEETKEAEEAESSEEPTGSEDESPAGDEFDEVTLKEAKNLYLALKGEQGPAIIAALAQNAGLLNKPETKQEVKQNVRALSQIVEEALGAEFKMIAPQMTRLLTDVLEQERSDRAARFNEIEQQNTAREVTSTMDKIAKENKISSEQLGKLIEPLTKDLLPGPKTSVETYIRSLYKQATVGKLASRTSAQIADKARRNASDAPSRLHSAGSVSESNKAPKKMNLNDSIKHAMQQLEQKK